MKKLPIHQEAKKTGIRIPYPQTFFAAMQNRNGNAGIGLIVGRV